MNQNMRDEIKRAGLYQYQVAYEMGVNEITFIRWLRRPLKSDKENAIKAAIKRLVDKGENRAEL